MKPFSCNLTLKHKQQIWETFAFTFFEIICLDISYT